MFMPTTVSGRLWIVICGLWIIFSLLLCRDTSLDIFGSRDAASLIATFATLASAPFWAPLYTWVTKTGAWRACLWISGTLLIGFLILVVEAEAIISLLWWAIFTVGFWLMPRPGQAPMGALRGILKSRATWATLCATFLAAITGWVAAQLPYMIEDQEILLGGSRLEFIIPFQIGFLLPSGLMILGPSLIIALIKVAMHNSMKVYPRTLIVSVTVLGVLVLAFHATTQAI